MVRLVGALLIEQNDEGAIERRYMVLETLAQAASASSERPRRALKWRRDRGRSVRITGVEGITTVPDLDHGTAPQGNFARVEPPLPAILPW